MNDGGIPSLDGALWTDSTLRGHAARGTGLNELYIGKRVWKRLRYIKAHRCRWLGSWLRIPSRAPPPRQRWRFAPSHPSPPAQDRELLLSHQGVAADRHPVRQARPKLLSLRVVELILAERGGIVTHESIRASLGDELPIVGDFETEDAKVGNGAEIRFDSPIPETHRPLSDRSAVHLWSSGLDSKHEAAPVVCVSFSGAIRRSDHSPHDPGLMIPERPLKPLVRYRRVYEGAEENRAVALEQHDCLVPGCPAIVRRGASVSAVMQKSLTFRLSSCAARSIRN